MVHVDVLNMVITLYSVLCTLYLKITCTQPDINTQHYTKCLYVHLHAEATVYTCMYTYVNSLIFRLPGFFTVATKKLESLVDKDNIHVYVQYNVHIHMYMCTFRQISSSWASHTHSGSRVLVYISAQTMQVDNFTDTQTYTCTHTHTHTHTHTATAG